MLIKKKRIFYTYFKEISEGFICKMYIYLLSKLFNFIHNLKKIKIIDFNGPPYQERKNFVIPIHHYHRH